MFLSVVFDRNEVAVVATTNVIDCVGTEPGMYGNWVLQWMILDVFLLLDTDEVDAWYVWNDGWFIFLHF